MNSAPNSLIGFFVRHPVASNLLMGLIILFGLYGLSQLSRQVMPSLTATIITVRVDWLGASAEDIDKNVIGGIEQAVRFLEDVEDVESIAVENRGQVSIAFTEGTNMTRALNDVQGAVARVKTLPKDIERPIISSFLKDERVARLDISGPFSEQTLINIAKGIRDDLLARGLPKVMISGARDREIWVEVPLRILQELDLTFQDISRRIARASLDLPSGDVEVGGSAKLVRSEGSGGTASEISDIEIVAGKAGEKVLLKDIAMITETFSENSVSRFSNGRTSVSLSISRSPESDSIKAQKILDDYIAESRSILPSNLIIEQHDIYGAQVKEFIDRLAFNAVIGLAIVAVVLFIFFSNGVATWVAISIPISILMTLGLCMLMGVTLNIVTLFTIILGLGIVVDDAIVVSDRTLALFESGKSPAEAARQGASEMFLPILAASLTTIAAFAPLLTIGTYVGQVIAPIPLTIIFLIIGSFIECFLILPMHLRAVLARKQPDPGRVALLFNHFRSTHFRRIVSFCYRRRYTTLITAVCVLLLSMMLMVTGRVTMNFNPTIEGNLTVANFAFAPGTPRETTMAMVQELERASRAVEAQQSDDGRTLVAHRFGVTGSNENELQNEVGLVSASHLGAFIIELVERDHRNIHLHDFMRAWRAEVKPIPGVEEFSISEVLVDAAPGADMELSLFGTDFDALKSASQELRRKMAMQSGIMNLKDNAPYGKQELVMVVTPAGKAMGLTNEVVAQQVRNAFDGAIAKRIPGDDEEILIRVKLPKSAGQSNAIRTLYLRTPDGSAVPLTEVVDIDTRIGPSSIRRLNGQLQLTVIAELNIDVMTVINLLAILQKDTIPTIARDYGIKIEPKGKVKREQKAFADIGTAYQVAMVAMYIVLAWVFVSYATPLVAMSILPFGFIGVIVGHYLFDFNVSYLGLTGFMGLMGVMLNDSIILILAIKRRIAAGESMENAVLNGTSERLRPILLTTITTIGVLIPIIFDQSLAGDFFKPLAVTLGLGILVSTVMVLTWIPAMLGVGDDIRQKAFRRTLSHLPGEAR